MITALNQIEHELCDLRTRLERMVAIVADQQQILDLCPNGLPDGTGMMSAEGWIKWARKRLGYVDFDGQGDGQ